MAFREHKLEAPEGGWDQDTLDLLGCAEITAYRLNARQAFEFLQASKDGDQAALLPMLGHSLVKDGKQAGANLAAEIPVIDIGHIVPQLTKLNGWEKPKGETLDPKSQQI